MSDTRKKDLVVPEQYDIKQSILNKSRPDKFVMILNLPDALRKLKSETRSNRKIDFDSLQFTIKGSPVPTIIVPAVVQPYAGQSLKISSHTRQTYENVFIDFEINNTYDNWWVIYYWLNLLNDEFESRFNANDDAVKENRQAMQDYTAKFTIMGLDEYSNPVIRFDYDGAFPVSLTSPQFNDEDGDVQNRSRLEFAFTFFSATLI